MQKILLYCFLCLSLGACNSKPTTSTIQPPLPDSNVVKSGEPLEIDSTELLTEEEKLNYAWYYVVVADTGNQYSVLYDDLKTLEKNTQLPINLMGRYYNAQKKQIILREDDEDQLYAGHYFPRRFPENSLSVEYWYYFSPNSSERTMAAIAGITEQASEADSLLQVIRPWSPKAHRIKSKVYIGCLH